MEHGSPVRRSFRATPRRPRTCPRRRSPVRHRRPDEPGELGRVELAPNYTAGARVRRLRRARARPHATTATARASRRGRRYARRDRAARGRHRQRRAGRDVDQRPGGAQLVQVGDLLVAIQMRYVGRRRGQQDDDTTIDVYDLSDPTAPRKRGSLTTDRISPATDGYYGDGSARRCRRLLRLWSLRRLLRRLRRFATVGDAMVFPRDEAAAEEHRLVRGLLRVRAASRLQLRRATGAA